MNSKTLILIIVGVAIVAGAALFLSKKDEAAPTQNTTTGQSSNTIEQKYKANCADVKIPIGQELDISADPETGLATIGYADEGGQLQQVVLYYKSTDGFAGCSEDAKRVLSQIQSNEKN